MRALAIFAAAVVVAGACGGKAGPDDFASEAEGYIEGDLANEGEVGGLTFTEAQCDEPASTDVGATYTCVAVGSDGQTYSFGVRITEEDALSIETFTPIASGATTTTTTATTVPG